MNAPIKSIKAIVLLAVLAASPGQAQTTCPMDHSGPGVTASVSFSPTQPVIVPVFFHVITGSGGAGAVTDAQIRRQIAILNAAFSAIGSLYSFPLAGISRVVNDVWFTGIRYQTTAADVLKERDAKQALAQDPAHALNIYTADLAGDQPFGTLLGFARWPFPEDYSVGRAG